MSDITIKRVYEAFGVGPGQVGIGYKVTITRARGPRMITATIEGEGVTEALAAADDLWHQIADAAEARYSKTVAPR